LHYSHLKSPSLLYAFSLSFCPFLCLVTIVSSTFFLYLPSPFFFSLFFLSLLFTNYIAFMNFIPLSNCVYNPCVFILCSVICQAPISGAAGNYYVHTWIEHDNSCEDNPDDCPDDIGCPIWDTCGFECRGGCKVGNGTLREESYVCTTPSNKTTDACGRAALSKLVEYGWETAWYLILAAPFAIKCLAYYNATDCKPYSWGNVCWHFTCAWLDCAQYQVVECTNQKLELLPKAWKCDPSNYGTKDGCHCNCGTWDPDCSDDLKLPTIGCPNDDICIHPGNKCLPRSAILSDRKKLELLKGNNIFQSSYKPIFGPYSLMSISEIPTIWRCPYEYYGSNDGCDNECGAIDPDC